MGSLTAAIDAGHSDQLDSNNRAEEDGKDEGVSPLLFTLFTLVITRKHSASHNSL